MFHLDKFQNNLKYINDILINSFPLSSKLYFVLKQNFKDNNLFLNVDMDTVLSKIIKTKNK